MEQAFWRSELGQLSLMRVGGFMRNGWKGYDRLAVIMILIVYVFVGGISGFGASGSGHLPQETVHLPIANRDSGISGDVRFDHRLAGESGIGLHPTGAIRLASDQAAGTAPPPASKSSATANDFAQFFNLVLSVLTDARVSGPPFDALTVAVANPERWLRTVVLHL